MKILVASDKWKGCLSAPAACAAMARGLRREFPAAEIVERPIADGGEGTLVAVFEALANEAVAGSLRVEHTDRKSFEFDYVFLKDRTALVEVASVVGLERIRLETLDPAEASSYAVGQMIAAVQASLTPRRIVVGLGGSGTNDGGWGMAHALGWREIAGRLDGSQVLKLAPIIAACDVSNPLLGPDGCTRVFGPQKGIQPAEFEWHEARLARLAAQFPPEIATSPGAGAAGGLGFGLMAFCGAVLVSGFGLVAELIDLETAVATADLIVTGEGSLDSQSLGGKGPHGVAQISRRHGKAVLGIGGRVTPEAAAAFDLTLGVTPPEMPLSEALPRAAVLIESALTGATIQECRVAELSGKMTFQWKSTRPPHPLETP